MKILVSAGGTGGHVYPAYGLIQWIKDHHPEDQIVFIGSKGRLEEKVIPVLGVSFIGLPMRGLPRKFSLGIISTLVLTLFSFFLAFFYILRLNPRAIIAFGGYVTLPVVLAGKLLGKKIILHEQNSVPGLANRILAPLAYRVVLNLPVVRPLSKSKTLLAGTPLRREILQCSREEGFQRLGLDPSRKVLLVMGGSQGAQFINQLIITLLPEIENNFPDWQIIHLTGPKQFDFVISITEKIALSRYYPFSYKEDMAAVLAVSDLAICRAGASSLVELSGKGIPAILIPYPAATENHQYHNARYFYDAGAAFLFEEKDLDPMEFKNFLFRLMEESEERNKVKMAIQKLFQWDSSDKIYSLL